MNYDGFYALQARMTKLNSMHKIQKIQNLSFSAKLITVAELMFADMHCTYSTKISVSIP